VIESSPSLKFQVLWLNQWLWKKMLFFQRHGYCQSGNEIVY